MSSQSDRDKRLNSFNETFRRQLEDTNRELRNDIKLILSRDFEDEFRKAEFSAQKGDMVDAYIHKLLSDYINGILRGYE